jgi:lysozyme
MTVKDTAVPTRLSAQGAEFIGHFEGFRGQLYNDAVGHCTIGYGHLVHHGNCNGSEPAEFKKGLSQAEAVTLLERDAQIAADAVHRSVRVHLNQAQFDALVSFTFNLGVCAFEGSTLLKDLNAGNYAAVPGQLRQWTHAGGKVLPGLVTRRNAEAELFSTGHYAS